MLEADGKSFELDDLSSPLPAGPFKFQFERNRMALGAVTTLVEEGDAAAGEQRRRAGRVSRRRRDRSTDPRPHYFAGLALMGLGRYPEAVESYELTERLAPGWYHCRAGRALALELAARQITHATFESVRALEDGGKPATERAALAIWRCARRRSSPSCTC